MIWTILCCAGSVALGVVIGKWILRGVSETVGTATPPYTVTLNAANVENAKGGK